ncbi:hypothetical protein H9P43_007993 [Blastocladiella emersonii ATCC 22665]|nr:hypothetical protein H9P43_007993 [Blastocladiella emersonii ATCC 22665]
MASAAVRLSHAGYPLHHHHAGARASSAHHAVHHHQGYAQQQQQQQQQQHHYAPAPRQRHYASPASSSSSAAHPDGPWGHSAPVPVTSLSSSSSSRSAATLPAPAPYYPHRRVTAVNVRAMSPASSAASSAADDLHYLHRWGSASPPPAAGLHHHLHHHLPYSAAARYGSASLALAAEDDLGSATGSASGSSPALGFLGLDPFSLAEDAAFCPLPIATLAEDHGVNEDDVRGMLAGLTADLPSLHYPGGSDAGSLYAPRTPSPHSSRSSSRGSNNGGGAAGPGSRTRAWSASSDDAAPSAPSASAARRGVRIVHPSTRQEIDLRSVQHRRR